MGPKPLMAAVLFILALMSQPAEAGAFRAADWGDTEAEVRQAESADFVAASTPLPGLKILVFGDHLAGLDVFVVYILAEDRLVHAKYAFAEDHFNANLFLADFAAVGTILQEKYGDPLEAGTVWRNGEREEAEWGTAISMGELILIARWQTEETEIYHLLRGDNLTIHHEVEYISRELGDLETELREKAEKEKF